MAYDSRGLHMILPGMTNVWVLDTVDTLVSAVGAGYIADATSSTTSGTAGRGMQLGDLVHIRVVAAVPLNGTPPAAAPTAYRTAVVTGLNAATGAGSLTASS